MIKVQDVEFIRKKFHQDGWKIREIARKLWRRFHRNHSPIHRTAANPSLKVKIPGRLCRPRYPSPA